MLSSYDIPSTVPVAVEPGTIYESIGTARIGPYTVLGTLECEQTGRDLVRLATPGGRELAVTLARLATRFERRKG